MYIDRKKLRRVATALQERIDDPNYHAAFSDALHDYRVETEPSVAIALLDALEAAEIERDAARAELQNIVDADIRNFGAMEPNLEFRLWAQRRARHTLARKPA